MIGYPPTLIQKILGLIVIKGDCWEWAGWHWSEGYAGLKFRNKNRKVYRLINEICEGAIPDGYEVDHLCRNKGCIRPSHLESVPKRINILRGVGPTAQNARKTHCVNGHPLSGDNLRIESYGSRRCKRCKYNRNKEYEERRRAIRSDS